MQRASMAMDDSLYKEALIDLNKVIQLAPFCASAYFNRADFKSNINDTEGALNDYSRLLILKPNYILRMRTWLM